MPCDLDSMYSFFGHPAFTVIGAIVSVATFIGLIFYGTEGSGTSRSRDLGNGSKSELQEQYGKFQRKRSLSCPYISGK